nr:hemolysin-like protein [bacterium]
KDFRTKIVMQMLWNGLAAYMFDYDIKLMFGCGSFLGTDVNSAREGLSYLYYNHIADGDLEIEARTKNAVDYPLMPKEEINEKRAFVSLPTMIKGYLRVGCKVSKSIFVDYDFNTFDVCIIFETKNLKQSYLDHYEKKIKG